MVKNKIYNEKSLFIEMQSFQYENASSCNLFSFQHIILMINYFAQLLSPSILQIYDLKMIINWRIGILKYVCNPFSAFIDTVSYKITCKNDMLCPGQGDIFFGMESLLEFGEGNHFQWSLCSEILG